MKSITLGYMNTLEFEDNDKQYDLICQLDNLKKEKRITEKDFDIIASMMRLHQKLPDLKHVLFEQGFILPTNEIGLDSHSAKWVYERKGEPTRMVIYQQKSFETMWNRSDSYSSMTEYNAGNVKAIEEYYNNESDYGRFKDHGRTCIVKIDDNVVIDGSQKYETKP